MGTNPDQRDDGVAVYVVVTEDRHTDPGVEVFWTPAEAVDYARARAAELVHANCTVEEERIGGRLFYATYCVEGDCIWVEERKVHTRSAGSS